MSELKVIKTKFQKIDSKRWWGDDFDVRFFLLNILKKIERSTVLDIGGGVGIILSEVSKNNLKINVDFSFEDLSRCKKEFSDIECVCASMDYLPLKNDSVDFVICANLLEVAKTNDIKFEKLIMKNKKKYYQTVLEALSEIKIILKINGKLYLTTPNNKYYQTTKLDYDELENSLKYVFEKFSIKFFNTFKKLSKKHRKLNLANIIPKIKSKVFSRDEVLNSLIKNKIDNKYSVSFFVEAEK
jgi:SAM-dependent methyltransferase